MKTKSILLGIALTLASSLSYGATLPNNNLKTPKVPTKPSVEKKETKQSDCFPVSFQSDCLYISGTWCGSMSGLLRIIDSFLATECPN
ncbi:hypothetical protein JSO56_05395 [Riemerella anatipestifer]|uniref:hypothetical protein n=1 Tax=Riemerella anatipestifer TaxID=34085 RepID=UPI0030C18109